MILIVFIFVIINELFFFLLDEDPMNLAVQFWAFIMIFRPF